MFSVCSSDIVVIGIFVGRCLLFEVIGVVIGYEFEIFFIYVKNVNCKGSSWVKNVDLFCLYIILYISL